MSEPTNPTCPHGLRPGTTVCLHCRREARTAARQRRYRFVARVGLASIGGALAIALIIVGLSAIAPDARSLSRAVTQSVRRSANRSSASVPSAKAKAKPAARHPRTLSPTLDPIIAEGRTEFGDSVFAERNGGDVIVHFDTDTLRTRFESKFEGIVRATLPKVYGPDARAALEAVPAGSFVHGGDLLRDLPTRGVPLALTAPNRTLRVWPVTRAGRDGPLVVAYRVTVAQ